MVNTESVPTDIFVIQVMSTKAARRIYDDWPIKPEQLLSITIKHLKDLDIYQVKPGEHEKIVREEILFFLKNSSIILELIDKARQAAFLAAQRGRSEER
jgi:hypothetical protein